MNDNIKKLQEQIKAEEEKIRHCNHEYSEPFYNPKTVREPYGYKTVGQGSDVWSEPAGYHDVQKEQWSRVCKKCDNTEHTNKQEPLVTSYKPKF